MTATPHAQAKPGIKGNHLQALQPLGLAPTVRAQALAALAELLPLWLAEPPLDWKRVVRPMGGGQFSINIEQYHGVRTWIAFQKHLDARAGQKTLDSAIRKYQPELLGYMSLPGVTQLIQDVNSLVTCWCQTAKKRIKSGASFEQSIHCVLEDLDVLLSSRRLTHEVLTPLTGLSLPDDVEQVPLGNGVLLRRLSMDELSDIGSNDISSESRHDLVSLAVTTALLVTHDTTLTLSIDYPSQPPELTFHQENQEHLDAVLRALHLLKAGRVGIVASFSMLRPDVLPNMGGRSTAPLVRYPFASMHFSHEDIARFVEIHGKLLANQRDEVRIGAARLLDAENRLSPVDALLDAVIGLEALLNPNDYAELSFRVALNYSYLGGVPERRNRYENVRDIQKTRNRVVHGGLNLRSKDAPFIHEHAALAKICLRDALIRFLTDPTLEGNRKLDVDFWLDRVIPPNSLPTP